MRLRSFYFVWFSIDRREAVPEGLNELFVILERIVAFEPLVQRRDVYDVGQVVQDPVDPFLREGDCHRVLVGESCILVVLFDDFAELPLIASPLLSTFAPLHIFFTSSTILPSPEPS